MIHLGKSRGESPADAMLPRVSQFRAQAGGHSQRPEGALRLTPTVPRVCTHPCPLP